MEYMCPFCHKQSFVELIDKPLAVMKLQCCHCLKISSLRHDHFAIDNSAYHSTFQCLSCHQTTDISHYEYRLYQNCDVVCATCGEKMTLIKPDSSSHVGLFCTLFLCNGLTIGVLFMWLTEKGQHYWHYLTSQSPPISEMMVFFHHLIDLVFAYIDTLF